MEILPFHHVGAGYTGWALSPVLIASFKRRIAVKHILMHYTLLKIHKLQTQLQVYKNTH